MDAYLQVMQTWLLPTGIDPGPSTECGRLRDVDRARTRPIRPLPRVQDGNVASEHTTRHLSTPVTGIQ